MMVISYAVNVYDFVLTGVSVYMIARANFIDFSEVIILGLCHFSELIQNSKFLGRNNNNYESKNMFLFFLFFGWTL